MLIALYPDAQPVASFPDRVEPFVVGRQTEPLVAKIRGSTATTEIDSINLSTGLPSARGWTPVTRPR